VAFQKDAVKGNFIVTVAPVYLALKVSTPGSPPRLEHGTNGASRHEVSPLSLPGPDDAAIVTSTGLLTFPNQHNESHLVRSVTLCSPLFVLPNLTVLFVAGPVVQVGMAVFPFLAHVTPRCIEAKSSPQTAAPQAVTYLCRCGHPPANSSVLFGVVCSLHMSRFHVQQTYVELAGGLGNPAIVAMQSVMEALSQAHVAGYSNTKPDMLFRQLVIPRQYFHSKTGQPILPDEIDYDSDDDVDESWILNQGDRVRSVAGITTLLVCATGLRDWSVD
jgi:VEFS-Box of polycomb protein